MDLRCDECRWWQKGGSPTYGFCKANPPFIGPDGTMARWPYVSAAEWCGKHTPPRPPKPAERAPRDLIP